LINGFLPYLGRFLFFSIGKDRKNSREKGVSSDTDEDRGKTAVEKPKGRVRRNRTGEN